VKPVIVEHLVDLEVVLGGETRHVLLHATPPPLFQGFREHQLASGPWSDAYHVWTSAVLTTTGIGTYHLCWRDSIKHVPMSAPKILLESD
jgi:hypothetical protein